MKNIRYQSFILTSVLFRNHRNIQYSSLTKKHDKSWLAAECCKVITTLSIENIYWKVSLWDNIRYFICVTLLHCYDKRGSSFVTKNDWLLFEAVLTLTEVPGANQSYCFESIREITKQIFFQENVRSWLHSLI